MSPSIDDDALTSDEVESLLAVVVVVEENILVFKGPPLVKQETTQFSKSLDLLPKSQTTWNRDSK